MKLEKFKENNRKKKGIIIFTIACVILIAGVFLYKTFAIFQTNLNEDMIEGEVQDIGDLEFAFYIDDGKEDKISKTAPGKNEGYSLDTSSSYCKDMATGKQTGNINWNQERWSAEVKDITATKTKCYLHFSKIYEEGTLNGAIPDLMNGRLIPVVISETEGPNYYVGDKGGKVTKADITSTTSPWYQYSEKKWANAVILKDGVADNYQPGDEIPESEIESYFVWIPRYKYKLKTTESELNNYKTISKTVTSADSVSKFYETAPNQAPNNPYEITFETKDKGEESGTTKDSFHTHPAFIAFDCNGFWVGKFETGYNQNNDSSVMPLTSTSWNTAGAQKNVTDASKVIIKPNVYSWRSIQVANAFYTAYNYKRELESHMMKNTEWGAVAYLTQSKYGRCESDNGSCEEVRINNSENYITGMSAKSAPTCGYTESKEQCNYYESLNALYMDGGTINNYYNKASRESSTTGNYSGVYDMSGGAWEYVMGVMQAGEKEVTPASGRSKTYNSGFTGKYSCYNCDSQIEIENKEGQSWPSSKYYDKYDYKTTNQEWGRGILGDATKEFGPFNSVSYKKTDGTGPVRYVSSYNADVAYFVDSSNPWFIRGAAYSDGTGAGVGAFSYFYGHAYGTTSFRVVLTP